MKRENKVIRLDDDAYELLTACAVEAYPAECCGMLFGSRDQSRIGRVFPIRNNSVSDKRDNSFLMEPFEIYRGEQEAERAGMEILGFFHSHPDRPALPSEKDKKSMIPGMLYLIIEASEKAAGGIRIYTTDETGEKEYECLCIRNPQRLYGKESEAGRPGGQH